MARDGQGTHILLNLVHRVPAVQALGLDSALGSLRPQVLRNHLARILQIEKVRSERPLGRVGVVGPALARLLVIGALESRKRRRKRLCLAVVGDSVATNRSERTPSLGTKLTQCQEKGGYLLMSAWVRV
jgi:hypothetical protein